MIFVEVLAFLITFLLSVLWIIFPGFNWEPWIVLFGIVVGVMEVYRRIFPESPVDTIDSDLNWLKTHLHSAKLSESLPRALRIAKSLGEVEFEHWVRLELYGYSQEGGMLESDSVPEYRGATGRWMDEYDRMLDLSHYPDIAMVNSYRLRFGVAKLEELASRTEMQNIADEVIISLLRKHFSIAVIRFCFSPIEVVGILNTIKNRLAERLDGCLAKQANKR